MFTFRSVGAWERGYVYPTLAGFRGKVIDVGNDEGCPEVGSLPKNKSGVSESNSGVTPSPPQSPPSPLTHACTGLQIVLCNLPPFFIRSL